MACHSAFAHRWIMVKWLVGMHDDFIFCLSFIFHLILYNGRYSLMTFALLSISYFSLTRNTVNPAFVTTIPNAIRLLFYFQLNSIMFNLLLLLLSSFRLIK